MKSLTDKTALVTGGGSGIGRSLVLALARAGARIVVADIMLDNARAVADHVEKSGGRAIAVHCDVCDADSLQALKSASEGAFGPVVRLVANAGARAVQPHVRERGAARKSGYE